MSESSKLKLKISLSLLVVSPRAPSCLCTIDFTCCQYGPVSKSVSGHGWIISLIPISSIKVGLQLLGLCGFRCFVLCCFDFVLRLLFHLWLLQWQCGLWGCCWWRIPVWFPFSYVFEIRGFFVPSCCFHVSLQPVGISDYVHYQCVICLGSIV